MGNSTNNASLNALLVTFALLTVTVCVAMNLSSLSRLRPDLRSRVVPTGLLDYGEKGKILKTMGYVYGVRNDFSRYKSARGDTERSGLFGKKREVGDQVYVANPGSIYRLPSTLAVPHQRKHGAWPLVSLAMDHGAPADPEHGFFNSYLRGGDRERRATISFYSGGRLTSAANVGVKIQGDRSERKWMAGRVDQDYRLLMRKKHGVESISPTGIFERGERPLKRLVLKSGSVFANELALDVLERLGAGVPRYTPVNFYLNGQEVGMYTLQEHVSPRQWTTRLGHDDFLFYRHRGPNDEASGLRFDELRDWYRDNRRWIDEKRAATRVDVPALTRNLIAFMFCGDDDLSQGAAIYDTSMPDPKWRWIVSEMRESFGLGQGSSGRWTGESASLHHIVTRDRTSDFWNATRRGFRSQLFARLLNNSHKYRQYFLRTVTTVLNHELTTTFLEDRYSHYAKLLAAYGISDPSVESEDFERIGEFLLRRHHYFRREIQEGFDISDIFEVRVEAHGPQDLLVDGYRVHGLYSGKYFSNQIFEVSVQRANDPAPVAWEVNNETVAGNPIRFEVTSDTVVRLASFAN